MTDRAKYWARMMTAWEAGGLTQAEFCRRRGLKAVTFAWWKRRLNVGPPGRGGRGRRIGRKVSTGPSKSSFVEVSLLGDEATEQSMQGAGAGSDPSEAGYEVALPCGTSIRLPADFDVGKASQLIQAARSC